MAKSDNKKSLFWTSYSDLMTSLFFAMLVLFVVVVVAMASANKQLKITIEEQDQLLNLKEQFETLTNSSSLEYDEEKRMFFAKDFVGIEIFYSDSAAIKPEYLEKVDKVGADIKSLISELNDKNKNFKYQLVIEGTAAIPYKQLINGTYNADNEQMYFLSYRRALSLYQRWKKFALRTDNTEVIIAGSGFNGINRDDKNEDNNKRFMIQIIPKIDPPEKKQL